MKLSATLLALGLMTGAAQAATLTFDGDICNGGNACSNWNVIDQSYGDITGEVDITYDGNSNTSAINGLRWWNQGYETLNGVPFSRKPGVGMSILFEAQEGYSVSLHGLDVAPFVNAVVTANVTIYDTFDNSIVFSASESPLSTAGITSYSGLWTSMSGLLLVLGPDAWNAGFDNIEYSTSPIVVPLPASGILLGAALLGLSRRRKS